VAVVAPPASAQVAEIDTRGAIYHDSDATTIGTTTGAVRGTIAELVTLEGRYLADIVSSASVDVVSAATGRWDEVRHEAAGGVSYDDGERRATAGYVFSIENDWLSHSVAAGFAHDLLQHQLTLGIGGHLVLNDIGRADDDNFARSLTAFGGDASATVVATKNDVVSLMASLSRSLGYHASPYRFAYLSDPNGTGLALGVPERHPETRQRYALALRYHRYLFRDSALRSDVRGYLDDWGIASVTLGSELALGIGIVELGVRARGYLQREAVFYRAVYPSAQRYMTADRELGAFVDGFFGGKIGVVHRARKVIDTLRVELRGDGFVFDYFDFPRLPRRTGLTAELGAGVSM
jgi:hypothetical protein